MTTTTKSKTAIRIEQLSKTFGTGDNAVQALAGLNLDIADNEFFTLLGPSGCGKTTLLRLIAGFEQPGSGRILLFGAAIDALPPNQRPVNTVFQHYALFPHMTVAENIAFGLRMLKKSPDEIRTMVGRMLDLVHMPALAERKPEQLSGGQQQRVALARALATRPRVLLLDEPLSALDLKLRQQMRLELKQLQEETGITFIFVTHDQEEALTMSDRIAVMSEGRVQQVGTPQQIYRQPVNHFVAGFIGETNFLDVTVAAVEQQQAVCVTATGSAIRCEAVAGCKPGSTASLSIRPENITLTAAADGSRPLRGRIERLGYLGTDTHYQVRLNPDQVVLVRVQNSHDARPSFVAGNEVALLFDAGAARMLVD
jgi:spermidine/putrescine transport system ATP-binding protein